MGTLSGCSAPYRTLNIKDDYAPVNIQGIKQILGENESTTNEVDIIQIHGMCTHAGKWALESANAMAKQLGVGPIQRITPVKVKKSDALVYRTTFKYDGKIVNYSALLWSPVLKPLKQQLCYDQKDKTGLCARGDAERPDFLDKDIESEDFLETRALVNKWAKDTMLDDCLADVMAYQGRARDGISLHIQEAILAAALPESMVGQRVVSPEDLRKEASGRKTPLIMFTSSLGSKVAYDAIEALKKKGGDDATAATATVNRLQSIFMAANQIPILQLSDQTLEEAKKVPSKKPAKSSNFVSPHAPEDALSRLLADYQPVNKSLVSNGKPVVVYLSDPNDALSYSLRNSPLSPNYDYVDVVVSNAWTWFGLLESPFAAHTTYLVQPGITGIIVNGYKSKSLP